MKDLVNGVVVYSMRISTISDSSRPETTLDQGGCTPLQLGTLTQITASLPPMPAVGNLMIQLIAAP